MHGASVGVSTLLVWPLFERFANEDLSKLDLESIRARRMPRETRERWMLHAYGPEGGAQIMRENPGDFLTWEEQERRIRTAQEKAEKIRAVIAAMPDENATVSTAPSRLDTVSSACSLVGLVRRV